MSGQGKLTCDFCSCEVEGGTLFEHGAFRLVKNHELVDVTVGSFLGCEVCASFFEARQFQPLAARVAVIFGASDATRQLFETLYVSVDRYLTGKRPVSALDRTDPAPFFDSECPVCGHKTRIDSSTYDVRKEFLCARCGIKTILISKEPGKPTQPTHPAAP